MKKYKTSQVEAAFHEAVHFWARVGRQLELPTKIQKKISPTPVDDGHVLIRLGFMGHATEEPVIDDLVRNHKVQVNILQANVEFLREKIAGMMVMSLHGSLQEIESAKQYLLAHQGLEIEVIGYVRDDDWFDN